MSTTASLLVVGAAVVLACYFATFGQWLGVALIVGLGVGLAAGLWL